VSAPTFVAAQSPTSKSLVPKVVGRAHKVLTSSIPGAPIGYRIASRIGLAMRVRCVVDVREWTARGATGGATGFCGTWGGAIGLFFKSVVRTGDDDSDGLGVRRRGAGRWLSIVVARQCEV
jgi:hypothetical protein